MKLRNKLIPIISAATVAATIAPISSCAIGQTTVDLINGYTPSIKKAVWEDYKANKDDMLSFYASAVNENPQILAQDMYWKYCVEGFYNLDRAYDYGAWPGYTTDYVEFYVNSYDLVSMDKFEALVDNIQVKKLTCFYDEEQERKEINYYTISFDFQVHMTYTTNRSYFTGEYYIPSEELLYSYYSNYKEESDYTLKLSLKNIPITINKNLVKVYRTGDEFVDYDAFFSFDDSFTEGHLSTSWIIQPLLTFNYNTEEKQFTGINHDAFKRLENNGYDWSFGISYEGTDTETPYDTLEPTTETYSRNFVFNEDAQFDKANDTILGKSQHYLESNLARQIYNWYLPSFYLSDIEDVNEQLWSVK